MAALYGARSLPASLVEHQRPWLDAAAQNPYLDRAMLRKLLTAFAIISGLAALAAPAEARPVALAGVELAAPSAAATQLAAASESRAALASIWSRTPPRTPPLPVRATVTIVLPTVALGVDRALE